MLNDEEMVALKRLSELDIPVFTQVVPSNARTSIASLLAEK